jgi:serine palmitoyltransferase
MSFCFFAGAQKLAQIRENSNFFRSELEKMGLEVLGDYDSPVMPIMLYNPAKMPAFSRECLKQKVSPSIPDMLLDYQFLLWITTNVYQYYMLLYQVAVVIVTFPATPLLLARARICISASHSKEDLIKALKVNPDIRFSSFLAVVLVI